MIVALILGAGVGLSLGLLGSGGSIITLPVLVYAAGVPVTAAVAMSLAVVGGTALAGGFVQHRRGLVHWDAVKVFGIAGMLGAWGGAQFTRLVSPAVLMLIFGAIMLVVAARMLRGSDERDLVASPKCHPVACPLAGLGVGLLTGFLGVGGGFLIVPALVVVGRIPMKMAIGTSLAVITINSAAGLIGQLGHGGFDWKIGGLFLLVSLAGMAAGTRLSKAISAAVLRKSFAWFVLAVAAFIIAKNSAVFLPPLHSMP